MSLEERLEVLEKAVRMLILDLEALKEGDATGFKHENDGGWFD